MNFYIKGHFFTRHIKSISIQSDKSFIVNFEKPDLPDTTSECEQLINEAIVITQKTGILDRYPLGNPKNLERIIAANNSLNSDHIILERKEILFLIELSLAFFE